MAGEPEAAAPESGLPQGAAMAASDRSDRALVTLALAGHNEAFEALMERYRALVSLVAYRQLGAFEHVEDVAQEAFVKAFVHLKSLEDPASFKSWLLRITANIALDHLRKRRLPDVSLDQSGALAVAEAAAVQDPRRQHQVKDASGDLEARELRGQIVEAIYSLPDEYQMPAALRYLEQASYKEISQRLGLREETLRKRIHRANRMLRQKLKKVLEDSL